MQETDQSDSLRMLSWNIQCGGFDSYDPDLKLPSRGPAIKRAVNMLHSFRAVEAASLIDAYRWNELYKDEAGMAAHLGYQEARFTLLDDERLNRDAGKNIGIVFATDRRIDSSKPLDLDNRQGLGVILDVGTYGLQVANVYLDDLDEKVRLKQISALVANLEPDMPTILVGDFNALRRDMAGASFQIKLLRLSMPESLLSQTQPLALSVAEGSTPYFSPFRLYNPNQRVPMPEFFNNKLEWHTVTGFITAELAKVMLNIYSDETQFGVIYPAPEPIHDPSLDDYGEGHLWNQCMQLRHDLGHTFTTAGDELFATANGHPRSDIDQFSALMDHHDTVMSAEEFALWEEHDFTREGPFYKDDAALVKGVTSQDIYTLPSEALEQGMAISPEDLRSLDMANIPLVRRAAKMNSEHNKSCFDNFSTDGKTADFTDPSSNLYGIVQGSFLDTPKPKKLLGPTLRCPAEYDLIKHGGEVYAADQLFCVAAINEAYDRGIFDLSRYRKLNEMNEAGDE